MIHFFPYFHISFLNVVFVPHVQFMFHFPLNRQRKLQILIRWKRSLDPRFVLLFLFTYLSFWCLFLILLSHRLDDFLYITHFSFSEGFFITHFTVWAIFLHITLIWETVSIILFFHGILYRFSYFFICWSSFDCLFLMDQANSYVLTISTFSKALSIAYSSGIGYSSSSKDLSIIDYSHLMYWTHYTFRSSKMSFD